MLLVGKKIWQSSIQKIFFVLTRVGPFYLPVSFELIVYAHHVLKMYIHA